MQPEQAISDKLIERRLGGWGCYRFDHPQFRELCLLAAEKNRAEAEEQVRYNAEKQAAEKTYKAWWDAMPKTWIRFGKVPGSGKSFNHRDGISEAGVSCYEAAIDGKVFHVRATITALLSGPGLIGSPAYTLDGEQVGTGSDGEPIVRVEHATRIKGRTIVFPLIGEITAK